MLRFYECVESWLINNIVQYSTNIYKVIDQQGWETKSNYFLKIVVFFKPLKCKNVFVTLPIFHEVTEQRIDVIVHG